MAKKTSFELYVLDGRQWRFEKAADGSGRAQLTELARSLDGGGKTVVLLKEVLDASGVSQESVVFKSKAATGQLPGFGQRSGAAVSSPRPGPAERGFTPPLSPAAQAEAEAQMEAAQEAAQAERRSAKAAEVEEGLVRVALMGVLAAVIALAIAAPVGAGVYFALGWSASHLHYLPPGGPTPWVYGTFIVVALAVFIRVARRLTERNVKLTTAAEAVPATAMPTEQTPPEKPRSRRRKKAEPVPEAFDADLLAELSAPTRERVPEMAAEAPPPATARSRPMPAPMASAQVEPTAPPVPAQAAPPALSPAALRAEHDLIQFIGTSLRQARNQVRKIDRMTRFGLMLYFGAGGAAACEHHDARPTERADILGRHLAKFGFSPEKAQHFAGNMEEYMRDERNAEMGRAGTDAMNAYLAGSTAAAAAAILPALSFWGEPATKRQASAPVTILFTDIVGSTELTQRLGDQSAQSLIHLHNAIARGALQLYAGNEVKHTGDGLMATFDKPETAVRAALAMQAQFAGERQRSTGATLHVRIGIHTGIAIREENDLFGSPVQLTRRLVDAAPADGIMVSAAVRREASGMDARFAPAGTKQLKGFVEPVETFTVS
ncbi:adenylate/guanylate cyclase domain-containing protein [Radicibacter daui]|uniref:adenylate/guanylate cyclase domain-containing protein n=1 Tax=Radicibacter daui TaxID=3064829 RepID=UPI0040469901